MYAASETWRLTPRADTLTKSKDMRISQSGLNINDDLYLDSDAKIGMT